MPVPHDLYLFKKFLWHVLCGRNAKLLHTTFIYFWIYRNWQKLKSCLIRVKLGQMGRRSKRDTETFFSPTRNYFSKPKSNHYQELNLYFLSVILFLFVSQDTRNYLPIKFRLLTRISVINVNKSVKCGSIKIWPWLVVNWNRLLYQFNKQLSCFFFFSSNLKTQSLDFFQLLKNLDFFLKSANGSGDRNNNWRFDNWSLLWWKTELL